VSSALGGGLLFGLIGGLIGGLSGGLLFGLGVGLVGGLTDRLIGGGFFGLSPQLWGGAFFGLVVGLGVPMTSHDPVDTLDIDMRRLPKALIVGLLFGLVGGLLFGLIGALIGGLGGLLVGTLVFGLDEILRSAVNDRSAANEGTQRSLSYAAMISGVGVILASITARLIYVLGVHALPDNIRPAFELVPAMVALVVVVLAMVKGGSFVAYHWGARAQLWLLDLVPLRYVRFLDDADAMGFLKKKGGAYEFRHPTIRDFVSQTFGRETKGPGRLAIDARPRPLHSYYSQIDA
jgi:hypothetical protein